MVQRVHRLTDFYAVTEVKISPKDRSKDHTPEVGLGEISMDPIDLPQFRYGELPGCRPPWIVASTHRADAGYISTTAQLERDQRSGWRLLMARCLGLD